MSIPVLPKIILGPAVIEHRGVFIYVQKDIQLKNTTEDWKVNTAEGIIDSRFKSRKTEITFTPVGAINTALLNLFFLQPFDPDYAGKSIFVDSLGQPLPPTIIHSRTEQKDYTFPRCGITKLPDLELVPTNTCFTSMTMTAVGNLGPRDNPNVFPTDPQFWKVYGAGGDWGTGTDEREILSDIYHMEIVGESAPYDKIGSMQGFKVTPIRTVQEIHAADIGIVEITVTGYDLSLAFAPSNLTQEEIENLLRLQDSEALQPGQSFARGPASSPDDSRTIRITADALTAELNYMGAKDSDHVFDVGAHQQVGMMWTSRRKFTGGIMQPPWNFISNLTH